MRIQKNEDHKGGVKYLGKFGNFVNNHVHLCEELSWQRFNMYLTSFYGELSSSKHISITLPIKLLSQQDFSQDVKVMNQKHSAKIKYLQHASHHVNLASKVCKYEMDPASIVGETDLTPFCPQTDKVEPVSYPFNFIETMT